MGTTTAVKAVAPAVDAILRFNEGRDPALVRLKYERMGADLFAFFRGADHLFASAWPGLEPIDPGPSILICGDLHLENFGAYRAEGGAFVYDINDFDEALVGPCSLDLVRCSTSILLASEVWGLSPIRAMRAVLGYLDRYREAVIGGSSGDPVGADDGPGGPVARLIGACALGSEAELLGRLTKVSKDGTRSIRRPGGKLAAIGPDEARAVAEAVHEHGRSVGRAEAFRVLDVAPRVAGVGSLGLRRYVALVEGDGGPEGNRLLDIKAARPSALAGCTRVPQPDCWTDEAVRVVNAQRRLQASSTAGLIVIRVGDEDYRLRELIPDENRTSLDRFRRKPSRLRRAIEVAGQVTARSHLRGARIEEIGDQSAELARWATSPSLDAVLASAVRFAEKTRQDYRDFKKARLDRG